jgi:outer membrane protein
MKKAAYILIGFGLVILALVVWEVFLKTDNQKIVFIENAKVFEQFNMKKDYDKKIEKDMLMESQLIDSIGVLINKNAQSDSLILLKLKKDYYIAEQLFNKKFQELSSKYTSDVNIRLNTYIQDFGKKFNYDFILGSGGQGNVMFVKKNQDVTEDIIKYINEKYEN